MPGISEENEMSDTGAGADNSLLNAKRGIGRRFQSRAVSESHMKGTKSAKMSPGNTARKSVGDSPGHSTTGAASANLANASVPQRRGVSVMDGSGAFRIDATNQAMEAIGGVEGPKETDPNKNRPIWIAGGVSFVVVILIAAIVGAVVATSGGDKQEIVEVEPTSSPTLRTARPEVLEKFVNILQPYSNDLNDPTSPQYEAAQWLSTEYDDMAEDELENLTMTDKLLQRYALAVIYFVLDGSGSNRLENWLENGMQECDWLGVACSVDGVVENLVLGKYSQNSF